MRKIIHIDMDAFFAAIEQNDNPVLRGKPVVVGSDSPRGVIAAASYEARNFGVRSAMPSLIAKRLCPELVFTEHRMGRYKEVSSEIFEIFTRFASLVEPLSVDEAFLDVSEQTDTLDKAIELALKIKEMISEKTGLTASAGISFNKFLAKLASDEMKPDGIFCIKNEDSEKIISGLPIDKFYGIGKVSAEKMHRYGIHNGADLRNVDIDFLLRNFGKAGKFYFNIAQGIDERVVDPNRERKSVGAELTFEKDLQTQFQIIAELYKIEKELWKRIQRHGKSGKTLSVKIRFDDFTQTTKSHTLDKNVEAFEIMHDIVTRIRESIDFHRKKVRLMGVTISNISEDKDEPEQLELWKGEID